MQAFDPVLVPMFLEFGSVGFFAGAFNRRKLAGKSEDSLEAASHAWTRDAALADFIRLRQVGGQKLLATRWNVSEGCVSKWMAAWSASGQVQRSRDGRYKPARALPAPR